MITNRTYDLSDVDFYLGEVILINKPIDWTSFDVVAKLRDLTKVKKIGHAGTLDPKATGLLILGTGKKTKSLTDYQDLEKEYEGKIYFGKSTPTMDTESEPDSEGSIENLTLEAIQSSAKKFEGEIYQTPPIYSAVNVGGKKAHRIARKGKQPILQPRKVFVRNFTIKSYNPPISEFKVICAKGTYVRKLVHDLGNDLGCGAYLYELKRTKIGDFELKDAFEIEELVRIFEKKN